MKSEIPDIGQMAPDFEVLNSNGEMFSRFTTRCVWCRVEASHTRVFALSVDVPKRSAGFRQAMQFPFELLCDPDKKVVELFHLLNPHEHDGIAYPAIFVINPQGRICYRSLDRTATRVQLTEVLAFLDKLQEDPAFQKQGGKKKALIIPFPAIRSFWLPPRCF